eukprot:3489196-Rhodomonas_salina.3
MQTASTASSAIALTRAIQGSWIKCVGIEGRTFVYGCGLALLLSGGVGSWGKNGFLGRRRNWGIAVGS